MTEQNLAVIDLNALMQSIEDRVRVRFRISYHNGEPTIDYSFPDARGGDLEDKLLLFKMILDDVVTSTFLKVEPPEAEDDVMYG